MAVGGLYAATRVYPRVCGGTYGEENLSATQAGLSPRVRGNQPDPRAANGRRRSIPACAGEPVVTAADDHPHEVYPRVCGGTKISLAVLFAVLGLSPRVRGNPAGDAGATARPRSIPACAGEPRQGKTPLYRPVVYPRVCGGTAVRQRAVQHLMGLSPRVRGNRRAPARRPAPDGSIPACAGEPDSCGQLGGGVRVYPRVCGGTFGGLPFGLPVRGLSPRVRGNRG